MKKTISVMLLCLMIVGIFAGCGKQGTGQQQMAMMGNPWSQWMSIEEAEAAADFSFGLPAVIDARFYADEIRTMNNELIEVVYRDQTLEICVRKQKGEGQDISGDYNEYETCTEENIDGATVIQYSNSDNDAVKQLVSYNGFSWSFVAPNGYGEGSGLVFVYAILEE